MPTAGVRVLCINCKYDVPYTWFSVFAPASVLAAIADFRPDVILTNNDYPFPPDLNQAPFAIRKKWINIAADATMEQIVAGIESCYAANLWGEHPYDACNPLISVFTPTHDSMAYIDEAWVSLLEQTYQNFEWVVVDDGSTDGTFHHLKELAAKDPRIRPYASLHSGKIGEMKRLCTQIAYGEIVFELDHDDMLVDTALAEVKAAFADPSIGMVYSNFAEYYEDGRPDNEYGDDFWSGRYRNTAYRGRVYREARAPSIYGRWGTNYWDRHAWFLTVGPNHLRAYRRSVLEQLGGYNPGLSVADDWDVFYRFFLYSKCWHIDKLLYLYRYRVGAANTTFTRNKSIQDHLALARNHYAGIAQMVDTQLPSLPCKDFDLTNPAEWSILEETPNAETT
jgi:O-antigen biosynthesis protein